jgi:hypothetical protein
VLVGLHDGHQYAAEAKATPSMFEEKPHASTTSASSGGNDAAPAQAPAQADSESCSFPMVFGILLLDFKSVASAFRPRLVFRSRAGSTRVAPNHYREQPFFQRLKKTPE